MKNKLTDLNDHLFRQLDRLSDNGLKGKDLDREIVRSNAVSTLAKEIIANGDLVLKAHVAVGRKLLPSTKLPAMIGDRNDVE
ncbi:hypothetical protein [Desulfoluna spongiiphila]|uniref:Uncharacterized protein n=1 Tax=Desulfoluna spongiiphila TaxID=419481 RepID=A0A1G5G1R9_9BACT|nr:hypothetical protein [Desulfoluna spongiiphila]SCY45257.1 hypothetical protein SAMN05216233_109139 [Desulfoluna spongiiphila]VVS95326.1 hypothetical protein DBB_49030 [Desulfoluna spongiiphila]